MSINRIMLAVCALIALASTAGVACQAETKQAQPAAIDEQPEAEPQPQPQPEPEPQPQPQQQAQPEPQPEPQVQPGDESAAQPDPAQPAEAQDSIGFLGESFAEVDRFSGAATVALAAYGDGAFPYDGLLMFWCSEGTAQMILADIPYVSGDVRTTVLQWVTPSVYGQTHEARGTFFDSDGGDRNWRARNLRPEWFQTAVADLPANPNAIFSLIAHLLEDGEISIRIQTYDEVFGATFVFGDMSEAEHWTDFLDCMTQ